MWINCSFPHKTNNVSLTLISGNVQDTLLTKLFGQFIQLHKTHFLRLYCFFFRILKNCRLTSTLKALIWEKNVGSKNTYTAQISASQDKHNKDMTMHTSNIANIHTYNCANRFLYTVRTWEHSSEITKTQTNCRQVEFHTVISWQVETKRRNTRGEGFLQIPLRGGEMKFCCRKFDRSMHSGR